MALSNWTAALGLGYPVFRNNRHQHVCRYSRWVFGNNHRSYYHGGNYRFVFGFHDSFCSASLGFGSWYCYSLGWIYGFEWKDFASANP
jgi:hypothetical protein